jgi:hypothetical protein
LIPLPVVVAAATRGDDVVTLEEHPLLLRCQPARTAHAELALASDHERPETLLIFRVEHLD